MSGFIAVEGIDGSGKSHLIKALAARSEFRDGSVTLLVKEHLGRSDGTVMGDRLAAMYSTTWGYPSDESVWEYSERYWLFSILSWYELVYDAKVRPAVEAGGTVVVDGWFYKHAARFSMSRFGAIRDLASQLFGCVQSPNEVLLLDTTSDVAAARLEGRIKPTEAGAFGAQSSSTSVAAFIEFQGATRSAIEREIGRDSDTTMVRIDGHYVLDEVIDLLLQIGSIQPDGVK